MNPVRSPLNRTTSASKSETPELIDTSSREHTVHEVPACAAHELATAESTLRTDLHASLQRYVCWGKRLDRIDIAVEMLDSVRDAWARKQGGFE